MAKTYDLNFRIKTDAKQTRQALNMTAGEFRDFNRTVKSAQTPLDRFEKDLSDLNKAFQTGKLRSDQYQHALKRIESQYAKTTVKQRKMFSGMKDGLKNGLAGMAIGFVGFHTVEKGLSSVREEMEAIDRVAKTARGVGASTEFLTGLEFAAQRTSGLASGAATKGIEKMTRRIEEAANGTGEAIKAIDMLGLEAQALAALSPEEQFKTLSRAMDSVTDAGERTLIATKLFDDEQSKLHTTMGLTNSEMQSQIDLAKRLGKVVTEEEARKAEAYADAMQEIDAVNAKYQKAMAMESMGGLNIFSAESQVARGKFATSMLEGDASTKVELAQGFINQVMSFGMAGTAMSDKTAMSLSGNTTRAKTQEEIDKQRETALKAEADENLKKAIERNKAFNDSLAKSAVNKSNRAAKKLGNLFSRSFQKLTVDPFKETLGDRVGSVIGQRLGGGLKVLQAMQTPATAISKVLSDPADSITAGSSEAFRLQNQQTSIMKTEKDDSKKRLKTPKEHLTQRSSC